MALHNEGDWWMEYVALRFDCLLALCDNSWSWIVYTCSSSTCYHMYFCEGFTTHGRWHREMKKKSWVATSMIMWLLCKHDVEVSKVWFLSHVLSIYFTPRCRCLAHAYTWKSRRRTFKQAGILYFKPFTSEFDILRIVYFISFNILNHIYLHKYSKTSSFVHLTSFYVFQHQFYYNRITDYLEEFLRPHT